MRVTYKTLERILEENPEYIYVGGDIRTEDQLGISACILNDVWVEYLGTTCEVPYNTGHSHINLIEKIFSEEETRDLRQKESVEKVKESLKKMRNCLATKDTVDMQSELSNIETHMSNLVSKVREKDIRLKDNTEYISKLIRDRNTAKTINRDRSVKIRELELEITGLINAIGIREDSSTSAVMAKKLSQICKR